MSQCLTAPPETMGASHPIPAREQAAPVQPAPVQAAPVELKSLHTPQLVSPLPPNTSAGE